MSRYFLYGMILLSMAGCTSYEVIIRGGNVYDGSGNEPIVTDIGIKKDRIATIGDLSDEKGKTEIDAKGLVVAPGFINTLSWAGRSLFSDGRSMSDIKQGVTLEVFGEGSSLGPSRSTRFGKVYSTFGDYMTGLEKSGVSTNIASFLGASTVRQFVLGSDNISPSQEQLEEMQRIVRESMKEGALGIGSSLIYTPGVFADTDELVALCSAAGEYDGMYISHIRSESYGLLDAVDELMEIASRARIPAEIYHLKAAGEDNWTKLDKVLMKIDSANDAGLHITTNMYNYTGASTGLGACFPPWVQEGTDQEWVNRLQVDSVRTTVIREMQQERNDWENFLTAAGDPANIVVLEFNKPELQQFIGWNIKEISKEWGMSPAETIVELVVRNEGNIDAVYFLMSEDNIRRQMQLPYMSFCSDARSIAAEGGNLRSSTHPRTYGNFARLLGHYVRDEKVIPLAEAIHKLSWLPAQKFSIRERGRIFPDYYADVVIFDFSAVEDKATYEKPHQYAEGMRYVIVNGEFVLFDGTHTGKTPGKFVKGPGYYE